MTFRKVAVLGAGSWGTALARLLAEKGYPTTLWARRRELAEALLELRENDAYLPGFPLPENVTPTADLDVALAGAELVVTLIPTHGLRSTFSQIVPYLPPRAPIVSGTKGIEHQSLELISEIYEDILPPAEHYRLTYLSGPSFAREVAARHPTAVALAGRHAETTERVQHALTTDRFRVYRTDDVAGVEVGGALKNVIAIAAGIGDGLGFGHNSRAGLITRGLAEISRLAIAMGGDGRTLAGLAGMGDLVLTCTGDLSRNRSVGLQIGKGRSLPEILAGMKMVAEGVGTTRSAHLLAQREGVELPITSEVYQILYEGKSATQAVTDLMTRPPRDERPALRGGGRRPAEPGRIQRTGASALRAR